jgi:hypothetical protein
MKYLFCLFSLSIVAVFGAEYRSQYNMPCTTPTGLSEVDKCDWAQAKDYVIGSCYDFENNDQCLILKGSVSACEKKGQVVVSAELDVLVGIDTWLGHKDSKDVKISFDIQVGTTTAAVYVHEMSEGILIIKAEPDLSTSRVKLWATYFLSEKGSCAFLTTDKLTVSAPRVNSAFTVSESNNETSTPTYVYLVAIGGAVLFLAVLMLGAGAYFGKVCKKDRVDISDPPVRRDSVIMTTV